MSSAKSGNELYQKDVLEGMMKETHNRTCADCGTRGIHRNMGVHISQVRSVTLDKWTRTQLDHFKKIGNAKAKRVYEYHLPSDYRVPPPSDDFRMEQFIRDKYERQKWMKRKGDPSKPKPKPNASEGRRRDERRGGGDRRGDRGGDRDRRGCDRDRRGGDRGGQRRPQERGDRRHDERSSRPQPPAQAKTTPAVAQVTSAVSLLNFDAPDPSTAPQAQAQAQGGQQAAGPSLSKDELLSLYHQPIAPVAGGMGGMGGLMGAPTMQPRMKPNYNIRMNPGSPGGAAAGGGGGAGGMGMMMGGGAVPGMGMYGGAAAGGGAYPGMVGMTGMPAMGGMPMGTQMPGYAGAGMMPYGYPAGAAGTPMYPGNPGAGGGGMRPSGTGFNGKPTGGFGF